MTALAESIPTTPRIPRTDLSEPVQPVPESHWYRYMDDIVVLGRSMEHLRRVRASVEDLSRDALGLRFSKWSIQPVGRGVNFVGYRIWPTHKLLRRDSVVRARRKIAAYRAAGEHARLEKFIAAWTGHAGWADSRNLLKSLNLVDTIGSAAPASASAPLRMAAHRPTPHRNTPA